MNHLRRAVGGVAIGFALVLGQSACSETPSGPSAGSGTVLAIDAEARKVTLEHGDIPGLMKAMTMTFEIAPGVVLEGIEKGQQVDFRVKEEGGVYTVTEIRRPGS